MMEIIVVATLQQYAVAAAPEPVATRCTFRSSGGVIPERCIYPAGHTGECCLIPEF